MYLFGAWSPYWKLPGSASRGYECCRPVGDEHVGENCVFFALRRGHSHSQEEGAVEIVHARCCGLDVHKKNVVACVLISQPDGLIERQVRTFKTMTGDLLALADWLSCLGVTHVARQPAAHASGARQEDGRPRQRVAG